MDKSEYNKDEPMILHVDLNSAFATIEQQSRPLLRSRPIAVINRRVENTSIITASYEAKAYGVKVGMKFDEAAKLAPGLIAVESDPVKYRYIYHKLVAILNDYSPKVVMKSIDEGVIDLRGLKTNRSPVDIGYEIKKRLREEVGCVMRCNVGIGTSRFMAKTAAGLHKPDGLDVIDANNLRSTYETMKLTDLTGIGERYQQRLNAVGIYTPLQFLDADVTALKKLVFKDVVGQQWHQRLRGYEVDDQDIKTKTIGRQYVLEDRDLTKSQIQERLHYLCESVGARLRRQNKLARGVHVHIRTIERQYWHASILTQMPFYSDITINCLAQQILSKAPGRIAEIGIRCYNLSDNTDSQMSLFIDEMVRERYLVNVIDVLNQRYGDRTIHSASTLQTSGFIKTKIPFGSTRYL